jgi:hypothetical protein
MPKRKRPGDAVTDFVMELLREALRQFPVVALLGVLAWYAFRYIREQHAGHLNSLEASYLRHLVSKESEVQRIVATHGDEIRRLTAAKDAEIARLEILLAEARKERDKLLKLIPQGRTE